MLAFNPVKMSFRIDVFNLCLVKIFIIMNKNISDIDTLISTISSRAREDENFKNELIKNPIEVMNSVSSAAVILPKGKRIEIVDQTNSDVIYINLSGQSSMEDVELTDEQLELVSGGGGFPIILR